MNVNTSKKKNAVTQDMLESLIRYDIIQEDEITDSADSIVTVESLWSLFKKSEAKLEESKANQNEELVEVQKYVEHVKSLNEERDQLTAEFEQENEKLREELKQAQQKPDLEAKEISDMCRQENLDELIGSSFSEQIAYLLVLRATLLEKLDVLQEKHDEAKRQQTEMEYQLKSLTSEDSELRQRMDSAMSEMGGMASKLTDALKERDKLQKEVVELSRALDAIQTLPSVNQARAETAAYQKDIESQKQFYVDEIEKLRSELKESKEDKQRLESDLLTEIEELQDMNVKLKEVNKTLHDQISLSTDDKNNNDRRQVYAESQKIIEEMQIALEEDEMKAQEQQNKYEEKIRGLQNRITQLENQYSSTNTEDKQEVLQLQAQLREAKSQNGILRQEVNEIQTELLANQRDFSAQNSANQSQKEQLTTQVQLNAELQSRNINLENELTKVWTQLQEALDKANASERERGRLILILEDQEKYIPNNGDATDEKTVKAMQQKIDRLQNLLNKSTKETSENKIMELQQEVLLYKAQIEKDKQKKVDLEKKLQSLENRVGFNAGAEEELRKSLMDFQQRALNAESQVLLISGEKDKEETQKLVAELNRNQLEDAVEMMRKRIEFYISQLQTAIDRYKNLKLKHKTKIRRIRELFLLERRATTDEIEKLSNRLSSAENALKRELSWKEEAAENVRAAERDRRDAINRANVANQKVDARSQQINKLLHAEEDLKSENALLQKQLKLLEQQQIELEKLVDSKRRQHQREELNTLLSSLNMSGSLPYMGNSTDSDKPYHENSTFEHKRSNMQLTSSYLNLSQGETSSSSIQETI